MQVKQVDLTRGVDPEFAKRLRQLSTKETHETGTVLFRRGDPAAFAYLLLMGRVRLTLGETGHVVQEINRAGTTFGWSSLAGRATYSASAACVEPTTVLKLDRRDFQVLAAEDPKNAMIYYKRLAEVLGDRLIESYERYEKLFRGETRV
jgi:CRP-like cAMP-binding protein